jgi:hypothetical protein
MFLFLVGIGGIVWLLYPVLGGAFLANLELNSMIALVLLIGTLHAFRQVWLLGPEVTWIESFRRDRSTLSGDLPRLLSPMAAMLGDRRGRVSLSPVSLRTLLDGIGARLDEQRETSRYLIGVLVFLGLLGTFYGLLVTVRSIGGVLGGLTVSGGDASQAMTALKESLSTPLSGMATAFSSSLFGLSGSLVLGFLDLQAGQAQNRFFNELEEWLSSLTRIGGVAAEGEGSVPAFVQALLEQTAESLDNLQRVMTKAEESRLQSYQASQALSDRMGEVSAYLAAQHDLFIRIADGQEALRPALMRLGDTRAGGGMDEASRTHLRNLDQHLGRLTETLTQGREQTVQEIRAEIRLLARTIAALAEQGND